MSVFRIHSTKDYTIMSNYHLRDKSISLKAKGLLSQMLSLPEDWDYTLSGLACINRESKDAIRSAIVELEQAGYVRRYQSRTGGGGFSSNVYDIYERPQPPVPPLDKPSLDVPSSENPATGTTPPGNPTQLNIDKSITEKSNKEESITDSFPSFPPPQRKGTEAKGLSEKEFMDYKSMIQENIGYDALLAERPADQEMIDEIVELMTETVCSRRAYLRISGDSYPAAVVRSRFLKLESEHIRFVLDCMQENTTKVRNIRQYLLAVLFNAPTTISSYYSARVNHDMALQ